MTITEKILAAHACKDSVHPGDNIWVDVDILMTHDVCGPGTFAIFKKQFGENAKVWDRDKVVIIPDHFIFTKDTHANRNIDILRQFVKEQSLPHYFDVGTDRYKGVCHLALAQEGFNRPGEVLFGTDSHTSTSGAFGMFSTGIGNTDAAFILGTGKLWVKVPESMCFEFTGKFPEHVMAKDVILNVIGDIGVDGATYRAMEWRGDAIMSLSMEERMTLCNMAIEAGGKNGIIEADEVVVEQIHALRGTDKDHLRSQIVKADDGASYVKTFDIDLSQVVPTVATPGDPRNGIALDAFQKDQGKVAIDIAYGGSCTGGKKADMDMYAEVVRKATDKGLSLKAKTYIQFGSQRIRDYAQKMGYVQLFEGAGVELIDPSCGACIKAGPGVSFKPDEVTVSAINRNFPGRSGPGDVYLASPYVVVASAFLGHVGGPGEL